jgi:hypothetical protein
VLDRLQVLGARVLFPGDPDFPTRLEKSPSHRRSYVWGDVSLFHRPGVAIVKSRSPATARRRPCARWRAHSHRDQRNGAASTRSRTAPPSMPAECRSVSLATASASFIRRQMPSCTTG